MTFANNERRVSPSRSDEFRHEQATGIAMRRAMSFATSTTELAAWLRLWRRVRSKTSSRNPRISGDSVKRKYILEHYILDLANRTQWPTPDRASECIRVFVQAKEPKARQVSSSYEDTFYDATILHDGRTTTIISKTTGGNPS